MSLLRQVDNMCLIVCIEEVRQGRPVVERQGKVVGGIGAYVMTSPLIPMLPIPNRNPSQSITKPSPPHHSDIYTYFPKKPQT